MLRTLYPLAMACALALAPLASVHAQAQPAPAAAPAAGATFSKEQLDQMTAPIALYPDQVIAQILMGATYPTDIAAAAKWSKANKDAKGDAAMKMVEGEPWDPSVHALVAFPQVIQMMGDKMDWTQNIGDAFLAAPKDVLDSVQRLRAQAQKAGNLKTTEQQKVIVEQAPQTQQTVIKIEPSNPETVYIPAYNPTTVYGTWAYPSYPPYYWPPPAYYYPGYSGFGAGMMWGLGIAAVAGAWGNCNWGGGDIDIDVNKFNNVNRNRQIDRSQTKASFKHDASRRGGVPYRDQRSQQQFGQRSNDAGQRNDFRGRDNAAGAGGRDTQRQQAQQALEKRGPGFAEGADRGRGGAGGAGDRAGAVGDRGGAAGDRGGAAAGARDRAGGGQDIGGGRGGSGGFEHVQQRGSDNAFSGARDAGASRQQLDRGAASNQSFQRSSGAGGGARAGGGGGGGGARAGGGFSGGGGGRAGGGGGRGGGGRR